MVIYRKYRPKTFTDMVGQSSIKLTLQNEIEQDNFVHAYLFCGPRGLGKTTAARLFAKAINCTNRKKGDSEPCNKCDSCNDINQSKSLDLMEIDAASHTGVDNVRANIIENTRFAPHKSKYKVFIIDEVHMLSISAFNALLKTLEEPPSHAIFILCTTELHKIPETIISRCQRFDFKKVTAPEQIKRLEKIAKTEGVSLEPKIYQVIASRSEGCMRDAETMLGQVLSLGDKKITFEQASLVLPTTEIRLIIEFVSLISRSNNSDALDFINNLIEQGIDLEIFARELVEFLRKLMLIKSNTSKSKMFEFDSGTEKDIKQILTVLNIDDLLDFIRIFLQAGFEIKSSPIPQLPLELAVIKICSSQEDSKPVASFTNSTKFRNPAITNQDKNQTEPIPIENNRESTKGIKSKQQHKSINQKNNSNQDSSAKLRKIKQHWHQIIQSGHQNSRDLLFVTEKMVFPVSINNSQLTVGFKYDLHKSRFDSNGNKEIFEKVISDITQEKLTVMSKTLKPSELAELEIAEFEQNPTDKNLNNTKVTEDNIIEQVLDSFGGEIVA